MEADYGLRITDSGRVWAPSHAAYNFGRGDFTLTALFQTTQGGTLIARKPARGGSGAGGYWVIVMEDGALVFNQDDGYGYRRVKTEPASACDGTWHSVACVRQGTAMKVFFDGVELDTTSTGNKASPLNVNSSDPLTIGYSLQQVHQFAGTIEDITLWSRALSLSEILRTMRNKVKDSDPGLVGFWEMNRSFADSSPTRNTLRAEGSVRFIPTFHCMWTETENAYSYLSVDMHDHAQQDWGVRLSASQYLFADSRPEYNFGTGDFTLTALFQTTQGGSVIARKPARGGSGAGGYWVIVMEDGALVFNQDDGYGYRRVKTAPTSACDGTWHSVACVRQGGAMKVFFDGVELTTTSTGNKASPLNVSSSDPLTIGYSLQQLHPFTGTLEDITLWNQALTAEQIQYTRVNEIPLVGLPRNLVGFWRFDLDLTDASPVNNPVRLKNAPAGTVPEFVEVAHQAERTQSLRVQPGSPAIYGCATDKSRETIAFPPNAVVHVTQPDGTCLTRDVNTDTTFIKTDGHGSVVAFCICDPQPGTWKFRVECPTDLPLLLSVQTAPARDTSTTIGNALEALYSEPSASHQRVLLARAVPRDRDPSVDLERFRALRAEAFAWSWTDVGIWAGFAIAGVAIVGAAVAVEAGAIVMSAPILVTSVAVLAGSVVVNVAKMHRASVSTLAPIMSNTMGVGSPTFGGTGSGRLKFIMDGEQYFPLLRNMLFAVASNSYDGPLPELKGKEPTLANCLELVSRNTKARSFVLLWDKSLIIQAAEGPMGAVKSLANMVLNGRDSTNNGRTQVVLNELPRVTARLQKYNPYQWWKNALSPPLKDQVSFNSYHQKIAIVSVGGRKCALVGGFNLVSNYYDDVRHPMYDKANFHTWHDTAVFLEGDAVGPVEREFDRRWRAARLNTGEYEGGSCDTYVKLIGWEVDSAMRLDCPGRESPYRDPTSDLLPSLAACSTLITNVEFPTGVFQNREELLNRISKASHYIYFENYTFHDVDIVKALSAKLSSAVSSSFRIVILVPHPTKGNDGGIQEAQSFAMRLAFAALVLGAPKSEWTTARFAGGVTINSADLEGAPTVEIPAGRSVDEAEFVYTRAADHVQHRVKIWDVESVNLSANSHLVLVSPARWFSRLTENPEKFQLVGNFDTKFRSVYVHSKLALFDDEVAFVGSANFSARSLAGDGECSISIVNADADADAAAAMDLRTAVCKHWGVEQAVTSRDGFAAFKTVAEQFRSQPREKLSVVPLDIANLRTSAPGLSGWSLMVKSGYLMDLL